MELSKPRQFHFTPVVKTSHIVTVNNPKTLSYLLKLEIYSGASQVSGVNSMVEYFEIPELPGKTMFRCERRNATLQVASCASMWKAANSKNSADCNMSCRTCPLGAEHAGEGDAQMSHLRGIEICSRCNRVGMRLIGGDICVSCWNRAREVIIGRNARGRKPLNHPPIVPHEITVMTGKKLVTIKRQHAICTEELVISALRDSTRQVFFGFHANGRASVQSIPVQGELF